MKKPAGYDEVQIMGDFTAITPGEHHLIIKQVSMTKSSTDKDMLVVLFDFAANDSQRGLIANDFKNDTKADKKWPHRGTAYIMVYDWEDSNKTSKNFKTFCTCFEKSNDTKVNWVEDDKAWCVQFKDKKIGGAFGKVHSVYEGEEKVRVEYRWFVTDSKVDPSVVPNERFLSEKDKELLVADPKKTDGDDGSGDGFMDIPETDTDELPF